MGIQPNLNSTASPRSSRTKPDRKGNGCGLRIVTSWGKSPTRGNLFVMDSEALYREFDPACERFARQGYNTLYVMSHPYRSPQGAVPWEADLTPDDADFPRAARAGDAERRREEACFARVLASMRRHHLKAIFNAGVWVPQSWYRAHPDAVSRFPDQSPQFDKNFLGDGARVFNPCFRSPEFLDYTRRSIRAWLRACAGTPDFESVLCRVALGEAIGARLDDRDGVPLFIEHQDTHDREWCHCERCARMFREHLRERLGQGSAPGAPGLDGNDVTALRVPLSPGLADQEQFARDQLPDTPAGRRLWLAASQFWSEGVAAWAAVIRETLREFYPEAELATISKYPVCRPLTNYPLVARGNRVFLADPYPMESGTNWSLTRYLFDLEVWQSSSHAAGQTLITHAQAYDNPRPGHVSRAPTPDEYLQQHVACLSRGVAAIVDFAMDHALDLCSPDDANALLPAAEVDRVVDLRQSILRRLEPVFDKTCSYDGAVVLRYHLPSLCGVDASTVGGVEGFPGAQPSRAGCLLEEYRAWKQRGVPVRMAWDEQSAEPTLPERHEFRLQGDDPGDWDLVVRAGEDRYVVTLINLRTQPREAEVAVALNGETMRSWQPSPAAGAPIDATWGTDGLRVRSSLPGLAWTVFEICKTGEGEAVTEPTLQA